MGLDQEWEQAPARLREIRGARAHARLTARDGGSLRDNPYAYPHPDEALQGIWTVAFMAARPRKALAKAAARLRRVWAGDGS